MGEDGGRNVYKSKPSGRVSVEWNWIAGWRALEAFSSSSDNCAQENVSHSPDVIWVICSTHVHGR